MSGLSLAIGKDGFATVWDLDGLGGDEIEGLKTVFGAGEDHGALAGGDKTGRNRASFFRGIPHRSGGRRLGSLGARTRTRRS